MDKCPQIDLGKGGVFCMAFVFTEKGTVVFTGSLAFIREYLSDKPPAHGIVHHYKNIGLHKSWELFGVGRTGLKLYKARNRTLHHKHIRSQWVLHDQATRKILGTWRYLPSCFLRQLKKYANNHKKFAESSLRGGLQI